MLSVRIQACWTHDPDLEDITCVYSNKGEGHGIVPPPRANYKTHAEQSSILEVYLDLHIFLCLYRLHGPMYSLCGFEFLMNIFASIFMGLH